MYEVKMLLSASVLLMAIAALLGLTSVQNAILGGLAILSLLAIMIALEAHTRKEYALCIIAALGAAGSMGVVAWELLLKNIL